MSDRDNSVTPPKPVTTDLGDVAKDALHLVQQEYALARQETIEKITPAVRSLAMVAGGGLLLLLGGVYLLQSVVRLLATRTPSWLASLLSGATFAVGGAVLMRLGQRQWQQLSLIPYRTINSLKEDKEWLVHQIKSRLT
jgi:hypothetical protein